MTTLASLKKAIQSKRILFLENDYTLSYGVRNFWKWCRDCKFRDFNVIYDCSKLSMEYLAKQIEYYDVIVFQTTWYTETSKNLARYVAGLNKPEDKKIIVECFIYESALYMFDNVIHNLYAVHCEEEDKKEWEIDKIK